MKDPAGFAAYTNDELVAELRRRNYGIDIAATTVIGSTLDAMTLGELGVIRRQVNSLWKYKLECIWKGLTDHEKRMLADRDYMDCVKSVRVRLGIALAEAKELVDAAKGG